MYVVTGATGHTGNVVAEALLSRGEKVRVIGRTAERLKALAAKGAEPFAADLADAAGLAKAFAGAKAVYVVLPPNLASSDYPSFQKRVTDAIVAALRSTGVSHAVTLSSIGADKPDKTGPVLGLHYLEEELNRIDALNVLHLRAGYFMENTLPQVGVIRMLGSVAGPIQPDLKLPLIATRDIGNAAADALLRLEFRGKQTRELQGQRDIDYVEVASIIGKAIGKSSLGYIQAPDDQLRAAFVQMGMSANFVGLLLEMVGALNSGHMRALEPRSAANTTPTAFETFVNEEFAPAYRQQAAA